MMLDANYIKQLSQLCTQINAELLHQDYELNHCPFSSKLVKSTSMYNKLAVFLLFKTLFRWKDLQQFDLKSALLNKRLIITQFKTAKKVSVEFKIFTPELYTELYSITDIKPFLNYTSAANELYRLSYHLIQPILIAHNSHTHIFRHLEASFLSSKGFSKNYIANRLGHSDLSSQQNYVHKLPFLN
jgi:integrase